MSAMAAQHAAPAAGLTSSRSQNALDLVARGAPAYTQQDGGAADAHAPMRKPSGSVSSGGSSLAPPARLPSSASSPQNLHAQLSSSQSPVMHHHSSSGGAPIPAHNIVISKPNVVEYLHYRFVIHDAPTDSNLPGYLEFHKRKRVVALVRACEATYDKAPLEAAGIKVVELPFTDGSPPPEAVITAWMALVQSTFDEGAAAKGAPAPSKRDKKSSSSSSSSSSSDRGNSIAVHCVAGLGRAPVLVCIALIEAGLGWMEAVELVRKKRRGALNLTQLRYLETYKPRGKKEGCSIM